MSLHIPRALAEYVLLGPSHDRRQLQDSPILGDVWLEFAAQPDKTLELLIEPHWDRPAGKVAFAIHGLIKRPAKEKGPDIAPLHGVVAARLSFEEVVRYVVPMTSWWNS